MAGINNLSDTWTVVESNGWKELYLPVFTGISLIFCLTAQVLFCIFFFCSNAILLL
jgi:hypothetical protein